MTRLRRCWTLGLLAAGLVLGCNQGNDSPGHGSPNHPVNLALKEKFLLSEEPAEARGVIDVRKEVRNGDEVVIVGRIGGSAKPFTGRASFTIVDPALQPCEDGVGWDYCCTPKEELAQATVLIKFVDEQERTLPEDARHLFDLTELQTVVVRGQARRDAEGNLTAILARGLYARP